MREDRVDPMVYSRINAPEVMAIIREESLIPMTVQHQYGHRMKLPRDLVF
jgi:hypothetical protein